MSDRCIFKDDMGEQCPEMVDTGLFCATHAHELIGEAYTVNPTPEEKVVGGGGGDRRQNSSIPPWERKVHVNKKGIAHVE